MFVQYLFNRHIPLLIDKIPSIKGISELMFNHVANGKYNKHFLQEAKYKIDIKLLAIAQHFGFKKGTGSGLGKLVFTVFFLLKSFFKT